MDGGVIINWLSIRMYGVLRMGRHFAMILIGLPLLDLS